MDVHDRWMMPSLLGYFSNIENGKKELISVFFLKKTIILDFMGVCLL